MTTKHKAASTDEAKTQTTGNRETAASDAPAESSEATNPQQTERGTTDSPQLTPAILADAHPLDSGASTQLTDEDRDELRQLRQDRLDRMAKSEQDKNLRGRLVLATGDIVATENTISTQHHVPELGVDVPVVSAFMLPAAD